jgi:bacillithiol system protein YtxJ
MNWIDLTELSQLDAIEQKSHSNPQLIFKHSTRCNISVTAKNKLDKVADQGNIDAYFLDLLKYRAISNAIAEKFNVFHESPQVILVVNGECVYDESHMAINFNEVLEQVN